MLLFADSALPQILIAQLSFALLAQFKGEYAVAGTPCRPCVSQAAEVMTV